jgi:NAD(P)-dependent dehydrogenase (short-subunit alcohol dehydrogenase family)
MGGWGGCATTAPYSAAKAAVNNLMETYYMALKPYGIGASALCPMNINTDIWATELRRPARFKNSGYNTTPEVIDLLREHVSTGIDPVELARRFKTGLEAGQVYIIPYPEAYEIVTREQERARNYISGEGMAAENARDAYRMEQFRARASEESAKEKDVFVLGAKGPAVGFAKARQDIDWVDDSKKFVK